MNISKPVVEISNDSAQHSISSTNSVATNYVDTKKILRAKIHNYVDTKKILRAKLIILLTIGNLLAGYVEYLAFAADRIVKQYA